MPSIDKNRDIDIENGKFKGTSPQNMDALFQTFKDSGKKKLVVHFHGGLVKQTAGLEIAEHLGPMYAGAGAYPVFFVWHSGIGEVVSSNLVDIAKEKIFKRILQRTLAYLAGRFAKGADGRRGKGSLNLRKVESVLADFNSKPADIPFKDAEMLFDHPPTDREEAEFARELQRDHDFIREATQLLDQGGTGSRGVRGKVSTLLDEKVLNELDAEERQREARGIFRAARLVKGAVVALGKTVKRFIDKKDHGLYATLVEEILREFYAGAAGTALWTTMKGDTEDAFGNDPEKHPGTRFLDRLAELNDDVKVYLVGHSTGAIYICHFLQQARRKLGKKLRFAVYFLAPAVRFDQFADTLEETQDIIGPFQTFGMHDEIERADRLVPVLYPHSLLYLVSGLLENAPDQPLVGMERFFLSTSVHKNSRDILAVKAIMSTQNVVPVWSVTGEDAPVDSRSDSRKHGDFDNDETTIQSLLERIRR